jgi:hypothetical protein
MKKAHAEPFLHPRSSISDIRVQYVWNYGAFFKPLGEFISGLCQTAFTEWTSCSMAVSHSPPFHHRQCRRFRNQRCHLFHLFYQVQIKLGSPRSSPISLFLSQIAALLHLVRSPGAPIGAFPKLHEKRTLWQF